MGAPVQSSVSGKRWPAWATTLPAAALLAFAPTAAAAAPAAQTEGARLQAQLDRLDKEVQSQRSTIDQQATQIAAQQKEIDALKMNLELANSRGAGMLADNVAPTDAAAPAPSQPVGEAPPDDKSTEESAAVQAIPREQGVLTPAKMLVFEADYEYDHGSQNRLVFRGIELVPGIQLGLIEASDADRDAIITTPSLRYGLTSRLELDARLPYLYRNDNISVLEQRDQQIVRDVHLVDNGIGDAEGTIRYELNPPRPLKPIWIASLRVKSRTGTGPFEVPYDEFGVAQGLATGSGFWGVEPGFSFLLPSDPIVLYGGASYFHQFARNIDRLVGGTPIGRVRPGGAIQANIGFGFALNPRFSYSMGVSDTFIAPTDSEIGDTIQRSARLQAGQLQFGMSYRFTERQSVNLSFDFGVTKDAPDLSVILRLPIILMK